MALAKSDPATEKDDFQINFNIAKQHLSQRKIKKAIPYLRYLQDKFPKNANLKYLLGLCYAELEIVNPITIDYLETASEKSSLNYDPNILTEERSPIYVYYYLCLAYAQNMRCEEAEVAREKFVEIYPYEDPYYLKESARWLQKCRKMKKPPKQESLPEYPDFTPYVSEVKETVTEQSAKEELGESRQREEFQNEGGEVNPEDMLPTHVLTKNVDYSTSSPLYGVQLGAFKEVVPVARFKDMKNVDAFMDNDGLIRYVVGHFAIYSQAESLLGVIQAKGYPDAFVVNVNNARKFSDEVISIDNVNIRATLPGKVEYRIQIGAFREKVPERMAEMYLQVEGIEEFHQNGFTYLTVGEFATYEEAKAYQQGIKDMGMKDAFVIALNNGKKISLQKANDFGKN